MKDKTTTFGFIAWHDKVADSDSSIVQILTTAGGTSHPLTSSSSAQL